MNITPSLARQWSRIGSRGVFGQAMLATAPEHADLLVLSADLGNSSGLDRFKTAYPERFLNTGIAEQNMVGVAAGLAKEGFNVFATTFAPFISMRAAEQVRMNLGYMQLNVKAVALGSGLAMGFLGNSHYGLEDLAVMRSIPNLTIVCPADCAEIFKAVEAAARFQGPMYLRLTGGVNNPPVYDADYDFEIGRAIELRAGSDVAILAHGTMVQRSLAAAEILAQAGISASVTNVHTLKPLDTVAVSRVAAAARVLVTVEEHSKIGGLGSAVAEFLAPARKRVPQLILGLPDAFGHAGAYEYLLAAHGLDAESIAASIHSFHASHA